MSKNLMIRIRINEKDMASIRTASNEIGLSLSEFMRSAALVRASLGSTAR